MSGELGYKPLKLYKYANDNDSTDPTLQEI